jgi:hypothetical protein
LSLIDSIAKGRTMKRLSLGVLAVAALVATIELAQGTTAGHMLKSNTPAAIVDQDVTGSIQKPSVAATKKKRRAKDPDVTGSIKPKSNRDH